MFMCRKIPMRKGVEGITELPFKLIIMVMLIAVVVPVSIISYRDVRRSAFDTHLRDELNKITKLATVISREGNLSSAHVELDISGDMFAGVTHVSFGDSVGGDTHLIEYRMNWRGHSEYVHVRDFQLSSPVNSSFTLRRGTYRLSLTNLHLSEDSTVMIVSLVGQRIDHDSFYT